MLDWAQEKKTVYLLWTLLITFKIGISLEKEVLHWCMDKKATSNYFKWILTGGQPVSWHTVLWQCVSIEKIIFNGRSQDMTLWWWKEKWSESSRLSVKGWGHNRLLLLEGEGGQLTLGKTRTKLNLCLQKVCIFHYYGQIDHKALI